MATSKQDKAAATAEQIGSMSLGGSVEPENFEEAEAPTKSCSACGKKSDALKKCTACKCVWYCDKKCQNKHRKEHRKDCKLIKKVLDKRGGKLDVGTEKDLGHLPDLPPQEDCPICMNALPIQAKLHRYANCCGKTICGGCSFQHQMKSVEQAAERGQTLVSPACAFCRKPIAQSDEELLARGYKRIQLKDPNATLSLAMKCGFGLHGLSDLFIDLIREAADLGFPPAQYQLGCYHDYGSMGLEQNEKEGRKYYEKAVEGGHILSLHNLGCILNASGNHVAAMRHWRLAASGGSTCSMDDLIECFEEGFLHHSDLAATMQVMYRSRAEMKSDHRDQYIKHLKKTGEYEDYLDS